MQKKKKKKYFKMSSAEIFTQSAKCLCCSLWYVEAPHNSYVSYVSYLYVT